MTTAIISNQQTTKKFWNMSSLDGLNAEITMYGEICEKHPTDWWTGEPLEGNYITPEGFLEDLNTIKNAQNITIKLNSCGGDLYTGLAIHNALKSLNKNITVEVEGIAASAASIIACVGNKVKVHVGSLMMIHGVAAELRGFWNLEDLKKQTKSFDKSETAIAEVYAQKTGMAVDKLRSMMTKETWMTGRDAVENGFADELMEDGTTQINMVDKNILIANGIKLNFEGHNIPTDLIQNNVTNKKGGKSVMETELQKFLAGLKNGMQSLGFKFSNSVEGEGTKGGEDNSNSQPTTIGENGEEQPKTVTENEIEERIKNAVLAERNRCKEIDELPGNVSAELKHQAKYGTPCNAGNLAMFVLAKSDPKNQNALNNLQADNSTSNSNDVKGTSATPDNLKEGDKKVAEAKAFAQQRKQRKEGK